MEEETKDISLENEQRRIRDKIAIINSSKVKSRIEKILNDMRDRFDPNQDKAIDIKGRVKLSDSASKKIAKQKVTADEIYDLIGFMLVVDLPEEYETIKQLMKDSLPKDSFIHDFDGNLPENNGYTSFHMGVDVEQLLNENGLEKPAELDKTSAEVQLKTYGMYMAQEATHDSIYKNDNLSTEQKNRMQSVMFPLIEKITDIEMYKKSLDTITDEKDLSNIKRRIEDTQQQVLAIKMNNKEYINDNMNEIEKVLKQYVVVRYIERAKKDTSLNLRNDAIESLTQQCNNAIEYLSRDFEQERMSNTEPTGFRNTDDLLERTQDKTIKQIQELSTKSQEKQAPILLDSAIQTSETDITSRDIKTMAGTIAERGKTQEQQLHTSDKKQEDDGR